MSSAPFTPANDLERLLVAVHGGEAEARGAFEAALMTEPLYAATPKDQAEGGQTVTLLSADVGGQRATALFTAAERIAAAFGPDTGVVSYAGRDMLTMVQGRPAILNPGSSYGVRWSADALPALLGQAAPTEANRRPPRLITPMDAPQDLIAGLRKSLGSEPEVSAAWLALAEYPNGEAALLLDIRANPDKVQVPLLMGAALGGLPPLAIPLDVSVNPPSDKAGVGIPIVARG